MRTYIDQREEEDEDEVEEVEEVETKEDEGEEGSSSNNSGGGGRVLMSLKNENGACIMLDKHDKKRCTVYEDRPTQCRTYPFWPAHVIGKAEWMAEASRCEGINNSSSSSNVVSFAEIGQNVLISSVHDRGAGEDWLYEESKSRLQQAEVDVEAFLHEWADTHYSQIVFDDGGIRIVDTHAHSETHTHTKRRLEFVSSPHTAQTEMSFFSHTRSTPTHQEHLDEDTTGALTHSGLDHSKLAMKVCLFV